jgi:hypothetical protein
VTAPRTAPRAALRALPALIGLALVTGCTATPAPPAATTTVPSAPSASPTPTSPAGPAMIEAPGSANAAIAAANRSVLGYLHIAFDSAHAGGTELDSVTPWVTGDALKNEQLLAAYLQKQHYRLDGTAQTWSLSAAKSTAGNETTTGKQVIPYGVVRLLGCVQSTNHPVGNGAPPWTTKNRWFPTRWTVLYLPTKRQWVVAEQTTLGSAKGAPTCVP